MSYLCDITLYLDVGIKKFGSNLMPTSKLRDKLKYEEFLRVTYSFNLNSYRNSTGDKAVR